MKPTSLNPTRNDLPEKTRRTVIGLLNQQLVDAIDLRLAVKQAHWNVKGPHFIGLHEFFDEIEEKIGEFIDVIAERSVQLGGTALGTARHVAKESRLKEYPAGAKSGREHVLALSAALAAFGKTTRAAIDVADDAGDKGTADLFTDVSRGVDILLWQVESHAIGNA